MKTLLAFVVMSVLILWVVFMFFILPKTVTYNCDLAEISPDFPIEVRKLCREKRK